MTNHPNRNRYRVDTSGAWRIYQSVELPGMEMLGTITSAPGDVGALARTQAGHYVQLNAGVAKSLVGHKVQAALLGVGDA